MEKGLGQLQLRWNLLRIILAGQVIATSLLILMAIPNGWRIGAVPVFMLGSAATLLTVLQWKIAWVCLTLLVQASLFVAALLFAVFGIASGAYVPVLLLALSMVIASEHVLTMTLKYSEQFSRRENRSVMGFNEQALRASLDRLYSRLAWDDVVFGTAFLISLVIAAVGLGGSTGTILSDPSVYALVALMSLAFLIVLKEE